MSLFNVSLCLPEIDVAALTQKRSIVAVTKRFILPDKSFALLPSRHLPAGAIASNWYRPEVLAATPSPDVDQITHWAQCAFCQQVDDEEAIAAVAARTIWTEAALLELWRDREHLFLSILQIYKLQTAIPAKSTPAPEQLYKFVPLTQYLEASNEAALLSKADFAAAKTAFLEPVEDIPASDKGDPESRENLPAPVPEPATYDVLESPDWVSKISEFGNSSDGHTFEKLVRKGLMELGFSNSHDRSAASLDPKATGGAGGLDFYANQPFPIVGECKASRNSKIGSDAATQIVRLGLQNLSADEYLGCIKIVIAAGSLTAGAEQIARGHRINIIRPETVQRLVESKIDLEDDFDLFQLENYLKDEPFGEAADQKIVDYLDWCLGQWQELEEYTRLVDQVVRTLQELSAQDISSPSQDFSALEIRAHHNAKYQPVVVTSKIEKILKDQLMRPRSSVVRSRAYRDRSSGYYLKPSSCIS